uniref:Major facilitator superfamily domain containing 13A n=1 Tax=Equus asinus TaxID=9793 RepID=A0A9L0KKJ6_EQUAS
MGLGRPQAWLLGLPTAVVYGSLALFISVLHNVFLLYYVDTFVSVYKINKAAFWVGETVFLLWNSLNDPLFGWLSDRQFLSSQPRHLLRRSPSQQPLLPAPVPALGSLRCGAGALPAQAGPEPAHAVGWPRPPWPALPLHCQVMISSTSPH